MRSPPSQAEIDASVANILYAVWRGRVIANTIDATLDAIGLPRPGRERTLIALRRLLDTYPVSQGVGASGPDFFQVPGVADFGSRRRIEARSSLPGGPSGDIFSPFFATLLDRWLTNDTYPLRQRRSDVLRGAVEILTLRPPRDDEDDDDDRDDDD